MRQDAIRYRVLPRISPSHGVKEDKLYKCSEGENCYASLGHKSRHIGQRQQFLFVNCSMVYGMPIPSKEYLSNNWLMTVDPSSICHW